MKVIPMLHTLSSVIFRIYGASRGPSASAELLVLFSPVLSRPTLSFPAVPLIVLSHWPHVATQVATQVARLVARHVFQWNRSH